MISIAAICIGASIGALARWQLGLWLNTYDSSTWGATNLPWGTLLANLVGGYLIGVCIASFQSMPELSPVWRLTLITGFLGALTTFSTFSAEVVTMLQQGRILLAIGTTASHVFGSLLMTWLGLKTTAYVLS